MDRNNQIWSGKRIVSLCLILCLTFSTCLTYVSGTSAYAAEVSESNASGAADGTGDTEQTTDVGTEDAGQNIQAGTSGSDSAASNGSTTDGSTDGKDTGAGTETDSPGGSGSASGSDNDSSAVTNNTVAAAGAEESALPANVLRADNEDQRGEQLKAQMQLQLQVGLRSGALRTALLTKAGEADEVEVSTPVAAELKREADFPEGTKASLYVYEKDELEEVQASLDQYLTQFDVEAETETQEDTAYTSVGAGSAGSESVGAEIDGSSAESGSTTESLELSITQLEAAEDAGSESTGMNNKATDTDSDEANSESTEDEQDTQAQTRQVLRTKVETVYLPLDLSIVDGNGDKLSETGSMTVRLTLGDTDLLSRLKQAKEEGVLRLYHKKSVQEGSEETKNAETEGTEANLAEGTENHDWEELSFTIQGSTEESEGYLEFAAESLSPFLFVQTEQVVVEWTADQAEGADTDDASKAAEGEDGENENASDADANAELESKEGTGDPEEEKIYPSFTSGLWGVKNSYEPIWEESDCLEFSRVDFVSGKDSIPVRFHTYLKGNPYDPEETDGEASDTESSGVAGKDTGEKTAKAESSKTQNAKTQDADSTNLPQTLGVSEEESDSKTTSLNSDLKETIAYTLTDDTFYLEGKKLSDADYDIKGIEWIFGTTTSKATTGAESDAQEAALTQNSAQAVALTEGSDGSSSNLELWVGSSDRQTVTIWVRTSAKSNTSASTDTDEDDENTENTKGSTSDNTTESIQTALDEAIGGNEIDTAETAADTQATTWKVAAIYDLTTETYLSIDEDLLTNIDGKKVSFADGVKGARLTSKNKNVETYLGMYVDANLYPTANVLNELENAAEISLTNQTEANASENSSSLFQKINKATVWFVDDGAQEQLEEQAVMAVASGGYAVTFDTNGGAFADATTTKTLTYDDAGVLQVGVYEEPADSAATFEGWYTDPDPEKGVKYDVDIDGNISPTPTSDLTLYAHYTESEYRYAVSVYDIGVDTMKEGVAGITFGPALVGNYLEATETNLGYKDHTPSGTTALGNAHRCVHNDSWSTIVAWNEKDPYVYEQCIQEGCTHSIQLRQNTTTSILNDEDYTLKFTLGGDGGGDLWLEVREADRNNVKLTRTSKIGNWGASNIRSVLNGVPTETGGSEYSDTNCLLATFPEELRSAIGEREVKYYLEAGDYTDEENIGITYDKLWNLSVNEIADTDLGDYDRPLEGTVYAKFAGLGLGIDVCAERTLYHIGGSAKVGTGKGIGFALRSLASNKSDAYIRLAGDGGLYSYGSGNTSVTDLAPAFTLKRENSQVTFETNGGTFADTTTTKTLVYDGEGTLISGIYEEPEAVSGKTFMGWYTEAEDGDRVVVDADGNLKSAFTEDTTLYAHYIDYEYKYAVSIYGIGVDSMKEGYAGLTFGPALGGDFITVTDTNLGYVSHIPKGTTAFGNAHRCVHDDDWNTIIEWNEKDPYVYEDCIGKGCTHSVQLSYNATTSILDQKVDTKTAVKGDGVAALWHEILDGGKDNDNVRWTTTDTMANWGTSNIRSMLNGVETTNGAAQYNETNCLLATFPEELQEAIGEREVKYYLEVGDYADEDNLGKTHDKLWLFSVNEVADNTVGTWAGTAYDHPLEGNVYEKFAGADNTASDLRTWKYVMRSGGVPNAGGLAMFTRSVYSDKNVVYMNTKGAFWNLLGCGETYSGQGVSPGFTLTRKEWCATFDANGGAFSSGEQINSIYCDATGVLKKGTYEKPEAEGKTFLGWYTQAEGGTKVEVAVDGTISVALTEDITLYAHYIDYEYKYAVSIYGIGVDTMKTGFSGLTFGPALGGNYITATDTNPGYVSHTPEGTTIFGNAHRCVHDDDWATIIEWNEKDPYVYEECVANSCTHSIELSYNETTSILNENAYVGNVTISGDGPGVLWHEVLNGNADSNNVLWSLNGEVGNWQESNIRSVLNGVTTKTGGSEYSDTNCLLATFPEELQKAIGEREVKFNLEAGDYTDEENLGKIYDKLWLFSTNEIADNTVGTWAGTDYDHPLEGTVYERFKGLDNKVTDARRFCYVNRSGYLSSGNGTLPAMLRSQYSSANITILYQGRVGNTNGYSEKLEKGVGLLVGFTLTRAECRITFDTNGGAFVDGNTTKTLTYDATGALQEGIYEKPERAGSTFMGWYTQAEGGTKVVVTSDGTILSELSGEMTVYAHYTDYQYRYAVSIYGIGVDTMKTGFAGLTFDPAMGGNYLYVTTGTKGYKDHDPTAAEYLGDDGNVKKTASGNAYRCVHNDDWATIIEWNEKDPYVYSDCVKAECTHSIQLSFNTTTTILNEDPVVKKVIDGEGPATLWHELLEGDTSGDNFNTDNVKWSLTTEMGNWQDSNTRSMLNGITTKNGGSQYSDANCLLATFPEELQEAIGEREVKFNLETGDYTDEENLGVTYDKLWLFSTNEIADNSAGDGLGEYDHPLEGTVYERFKGLDTSECTERTGTYIDRGGNLQYITTGTIRRILRSVYTNSTLVSLTPKGQVMYGYKAGSSVAAGFTLTRSVSEEVEETVNLTVSNTVQGNQGNKAKDFNYELTLKSAAGVKIMTELSYIKTDIDGKETTGILSAKDGIYSFALAHGEFIRFTDMAKGWSYEVSETADSGAGYTVTCDSPTGTLTANTDIAFTNTKNGTIPTLAVTGIGILLGLGLAAFILILVARRKRWKLDL